MPVTHRPAGTPQGGQFAPSGTGGGAGTAAKEKKKKKAEPAAAPGKVNTPFGDIPEEATYWRTTRTPEQRAAVRGYTANKNYKAINQGMREGGVAAVPEKHRAMAQHITDVFAATPPLAHPVTVYRGMALPANQQRELLSSFESAAAEGQVVRFKGFTSSTLDPRVASQYTIKAGPEVTAGLVMEIKATKALYLEGATRWAGEHEMLMNHGSEFRVTGVIKKQLAGREHSVVQMEQVK